MKLDVDTTVKMNNSIEVPLFGIGTWDMYNDKLIQALKWAFDAGYS